MKKYDVCLKVDAWVLTTIYADNADEAVKEAVKHRPNRDEVEIGAWETVRYVDLDESE